MLQKICIRRKVFGYRFSRYFE